MSPAAQRSADRVLEVASLDFRRTPTSIDRKAADQWHAVSVKARLAAAGDLAVLTKFGQGLPPEGEAIRRQIEETLRGEFSVWQAIDRFVEQRATGQNDNESFAAMDQALVEYRRLIGAHANVLMGVGVQFLRSESADNDETKRSFDAALGRSRAKLNWSLLGVVTAVVGLSCYCVYFLWPRLRSKPNEKKIVVVDR